MGIISYTFEKISKYKINKMRAERQEEADIKEADAMGEKDSEKIAIKLEQEE